MKTGIISTLSGAVGAVVGMVFGAAATKKTFTEEINKWKEMSDRHLALFLLMNRWVRGKQKENNIATFLADNHLQTIAVYGMSFVGETLVDELKDSDIKVSYGIDQNAGGIYSDIEIFSPEDKLPAVDAVVVTAITFFEEIREMLQEKIDCPVISLEDIL